MNSLQLVKKHFQITQC